MTAHDQPAPVAVPASPRPGDRIGNYRIVRALGDGGMGRVFEARHTILPRRVAIKILRAELSREAEAYQRALQEAVILESFDHPGAVRIFECGVLDDRRPWIAMELVEGPTLAARLDDAPLAADEVAALVRTIADVLTAAHAKGIVHRDLKPENVLLGAPGELRLIDWGIARQPSRSTRLTQENTALGTPRYMAPEQARGLDVDGAADVYALGVIAFEALAGEAPFEGSSPIELVVKHLTATPPSLATLRPDVPAPLVALIERMLAKDAEDRPTAAAIVAALAPDPAPEDGDEPYLELVTSPVVTDPAFVDTVVVDVDHLGQLDVVIDELAAEVAAEATCGDDDVVLLDRPRLAPRWTPPVLAAVASPAPARRRRGQITPRAARDAVAGELDTD